MKAMRRLVAIEATYKRQKRKQKELDEMYSIYEQGVSEGLSQSMAITRTSAETGLARSTVYDRVIRRYGKQTVDN